MLLKMEMVVIADCMSGHIEPRLLHVSLQSTLMNGFGILFVKFAFDDNKIVIGNSKLSDTTTLPLCEETLVPMAVCITFYR